MITKFSFRDHIKVQFIKFKLVWMGRMFLGLYDLL